MSEQGNNPVCAAGGLRGERTPVYGEARGLEMKTKGSLSFLIDGSVRIHTHEALLYQARPLPGPP